MVRAMAPEGARDGKQSSRAARFHLARGVSAATHFGFGAATGTLFATAPKELQQYPVATGIGYGLGVWAASYVGAGSKISHGRGASGNEHLSKVVLEIRLGGNG